MTTQGSSEPASAVVKLAEIGGFSEGFGVNDLVETLLSNQSINWEIV